MGVEPFPIGLLLGHPFLNGPVLENLLGVKIHGDHLARTQATLFDNVLDGNIDDPSLGRHNDQTVAGNDVAGGTQAIAV